MACKFSLVVAAFCAFTTVVVMTQGRASGDKVVFPENYAKGVMYMSQDLVDRKESREFFITPEGFAAARKGEPLPSGTVVTLVRYDVQLDAKGNPAKDNSGHFIKSKIKAYRVMEKRTGWGSEYPTSKRNGEWEYQAFVPGGKVDETANLDNCFRCHKNGDSVNFMFTASQLKSAAK
jgi:hypothetical protein